MVFPIFLDSGYVLGGKVEKSIFSFSFFLKERLLSKYNISVMSTNYSKLLNESQLEAVTTSAQHVRVIAGAGSGKTRVLTYRISYLMEKFHVDPHCILAVTFTNKAAQEMKERVAKLVGEGATYLTVSTFHSFCARFLRKEAWNIGYPMSFTIYDDEDQGKLIKDIAVQMGYKKGDEIIKMAKAYIGRQKTKGRYPDEVVLSTHSFQQERDCLEIYKKYEIEKMRQFAFDFDDLILQTIRILTDFDSVRAHWSRRFSHLLVDEFQDTNDVQYQLMMLLSNPETNIYVVGDPDQTIYTWRGANQGIILDFPTRFPDYQDIVLSRNYRSTKTILDAANRLISFNKKRVPKDLFTEAGKGDPISARRFDTAEQEASWVVRQIIGLAEQGNSSAERHYENIAVLYRSSFMTRSLESELASNGIPYRIYGGLRFYQRKEVKDVFAYFRLLVNDKDDVAFERIVNVPRRGIGETTASHIRSAAANAGVSEYALIRDIASYPDTGISKAAILRLSELVAKMEEVKKQLSDNYEAYSGILKSFITDIGYYAYLAEDQDIDEDRAANVNALFDDITNFIKKNPESTFDEYLQNISLITGQDDMNGGNYVSLMTIHVAKGLEFDNVFLLSLNEGSFPSFRAVNESGRDGEEEERRLAYVAMTRAKKRLFLSCNSGYSYVTDSNASPSRFFKEAGVVIPDSNRMPHRDFGGYSSSASHSFGRKVYGEESKKTPSVSSPKPSISVPGNNGITDWKVGDAAHHEKFGDGVVTKIIGTNIIVIRFDSCGEKTLLSTHKMLSRKHSAGGLA